MGIPSVGRPRLRRAPGMMRPPVEVLEGRQLLSNVYSVTETVDDGSSGSLRWAIGQVNADTTDTSASPDQIHFAIPTTDPGYSAVTGVWTVAPTSTLPTVTRPVVIDGYTQAGATPNTLTLGDNAVITVRLDGVNAGTTADGLVISSGSSLVQGLSITKFVNGIHLEGLGNDAVTGNFLGVDASGSTGAGNTGNGVLLDGVPSNTIGGTLPSDRNVISGNGSVGGSNYIVGSGVLAQNSVGDTVQGNYLGTNRTGRGLLGTTGDGLDFADSPGATIGGASVGAGNVIVGVNFYGQGIAMIPGSSNGAGSPNALIQANLIGTDATGMLPLGNAGGGLEVGSNSLILDNVLSASGTTGLTLADRDLVQGNEIGTDITGTVILGNGRNGIFCGGGFNTIGGAGSGQGNVISGNTGAGIILTSELTGYNVVQGNRIGVDITGSHILANTGDGLTDFGEYNNTIGGATPGAGNVISGNAGYGIAENYIFSANDLIQGNRIGTDVTGTIALGNGKDGLTLAGSGDTIGGIVSGAGNVISGNSGRGLVLGGQEVVQGNFIGTDVTGANALGNTGDGVASYFSKVTIGGTAAANTIAYNGGAGVSVNYEIGYGDPTGVAILSNSIHDNAALGIDLGGDGVTPNTPGGPHVGPNLLQNYPVLLAADSTAATTTIVGTLNSTPNSTFTVQLFASPTADPSGYGQGQTYLGQVTGVTTDASGNARFTFVAPVAAAGEFISATATDPNGNTSEFAKDIPEGAVPIADLALVDPGAIPDPVRAGGTITYTVTIANYGPDAADDVVGTVMVPLNTTFVSLAVSNPDVTFVPPPVGGGTGTTIELDAPGALPGRLVTLTLVVHVDADVPAGTVIANTATVSSDTLDSNPDNNIVKTTNRVVATPTSTTLTASPNPSTFGQSVTFTAVVAPTPSEDGPTGTVTFSVDGVPTANVALVPTDGGLTGTATFPTSVLTAGSHRVAAHYNGDTLFGPSDAPAVVQTVDPAATTTSLVGRPNPSTFGQPVTFTAGVASTIPGVDPTGTVTFVIDGVGYTVALIPAPGGILSTATITVPSFDVGTHLAAARYDGNPNLAPSSSTTIAQTVAPASTTTTVDGRPNPSAVGQPVTFTADVGSTAPRVDPTGAVTFVIDGVGYTEPLVPAPGGMISVATITVPAFDAGTHQIAARYDGAPDFAPSTSATITQAVAQAASATGLVAAPSPSTVGQPVTLTASVTGPGAPGGTVTFLDGTTVLGQAPIGADGRADLVVTSLGAGPHALVATFGGSTDLLPSASGVVAQVVNPIPAVVEVLRYGYHAMPTALAVVFSSPVDPATALDLANYQLLGPHRLPIRLASASLTDGGTTVVLQPRGRLNVHWTYTLTVLGKPPGGIRSAAGVYAGTNAVELITLRNLVPTRKLPGASAAASRPRPQPHAVDALLASEHLARLAAVAARRHRR